LNRPRPDLNNTIIEIQNDELKQTALAFAAITASLNAQTDPTAGVANDDVYQLPELLVTALLWESDLQSTTASVSAIDSERLQSSGTQHFGDLINTIPNLSLVRHFLATSLYPNSWYR
jgi:outer membrane cobalamin receptor